MSSLFAEEAQVEIYERQQAPRQIGLIERPGNIGAAIAGLNLDLPMAFPDASIRARQPAHPDAINTTRPTQHQLHP
jgi:hypothetical protein